MMLRDFSLKRLLVRCAAGALVGALAGTSASAWEFAHGDRDNSGFADVVTAPAGKGSVSAPNLGTFRPGAGPVIAPDGTVYFGTVQGKVIALHADGKPFWSRDIPRGQSILASPVVASDGTVYVIGVEKVRDNRVKPPVVTFTSTLHKFTGSGGALGQTTFPDHGQLGPVAVAPPNIGRFGGAEAIIVPTLYPHRYSGGHVVRLIAFSLDGQVLDDQAVYSITPPVVGGSGMADWELTLCYVPVPLGCLLGADFNPRLGPAPLVYVPPFPGVAIASSLVVVSDHHSDVIGYRFANRRFTEVFRLHQNGFFMNTPPVILPGTRIAVGSQKAETDKNGLSHRSGPARLALMAPDLDRTAFVDGVGLSYAPPTRLPDGRVALVGTDGGVTIVSGTRIATKLQAPGRSIAAAAASRTHLFVSAEDGFVTYDAATLAEVSRVDWVGGGLHPPAIGPKGHVYAIASNILFVFPPPIRKPFTVVTPPQGGLPVATNPGSGAKPQEQSYKPPMTANGNRLFACEELDGDDCGKGDHTDISLAWCQKQGYPKATDYDVDSKKVKAETLDGQFCSKNKCKVFDKIVCKM